MKYIIYKDFYAGQHGRGYEYIPIEAKTDFEAIEAADKEWDEEKLYLMRIMKKEGRPEKLTSDGWKRQLYKAVMCKRSNKGGWHRNIQEHAENEHYAYNYYTTGSLEVEGYTEATSL